MSKFGDYMHNLWHVAHPGQPCGNEEVISISDVSLQRQMLYDSFTDPEAVAELVALPPISAEVSEMELRAHEERMESIVPVLPLLLGQASFMGAAAAALQCREYDGSDDHIEAVTAVFTNIIKASVIASVSTAVSLGVLDVLKGVTLEDE